MGLLIKGDQKKERLKLKLKKSMRLIFNRFID